MLERRPGLEGNLGALELGDGTLALVEATAATGSAEGTAATTTATATTATEATAATATESTAATTTTTTTTAAEATVTASGTGSREVKTDSATLDLLTVKSGLSSLGLIDGRELNVTEALRTAGLLISGETDAEDGALGSENLMKNILTGAERKVTNEESVTFRADVVTEGASTVLGTVSTGLGGLASGSVVKVDGTTVKVGTLLSVHSLNSIGGVDELDVTETAGTAGLAVSDNATAGELAELGELTLKPLLVDVPGQVTNEEVGRGTLGDFLGLGLLSSGLGLVVGLTLLRGLAVLSFGVRAVRVRVRIRLRGLQGLSQQCGIRISAK